MLFILLLLLSIASYASPVIYHTLWQLPWTNLRRNCKGQMQQEICCKHDDVTFSASLAFVRGIHWSPMNSPHKGQWHRALIFFICVWINGWVNNREAGDLRRHCADYDVTVVIKDIPPQFILKLTSNLFVAKMYVFVQFWPSHSIDAMLCAKFESDRAITKQDFARVEFKKKFYIPAAPWASG